MPEQRRDCVSPWGAYRIPFLWSKAGIMEAGCSDMRATTNCNTSCRFSSCRQTRKKYNGRQKRQKREKAAGDERGYCFCSLLRLCNCSTDIMNAHTECALQLYHLQLPNTPGPLVHFTAVQGPLHNEKYMANWNDSFIFLVSLNAGINKLFRIATLEMKCDLVA